MGGNSHTPDHKSILCCIQCVSRKKKTACFSFNSSKRHFKKVIVLNVPNNYKFGFHLADFIDIQNSSE
jgi:hypothetical protein